MHIYRLFCSGTIEEKIYQRQTAKEKLSSAIIDAKNIAASFSKEYLREVFTLSDKCESIEKGDDACQLTGSFLVDVAEIVDVVKLNKPDWDEKIVEEEIDFENTEVGEKRSSQEEESECKRIKYN